MKTPNVSQFSGCLIGQCLGDALGFPVEGCTPDACQRYVDILNTGQVSVPGSRRYTFGQYTDDSQLARELLQSYVERGRFDPSDYATRIAAIFQEGRIFGQGFATAEAATRLIDGVDWQESGTEPPYAGNGSAMRAAPIGLLFFDDAEKMVQAAHDQSRITHKDRRCSAGAVAIAGAVSMVLHNDSDPNKIPQQLSDIIYPFDPILADVLQSRMEEWATLAPESAATQIRRLGLPLDYFDEWPGISPFVTSSVLWSLYSFLRSPDDYWDAICKAIRVGGDVDSTAAMTGAISGAKLGLGALPTSLARKINDRGTWKYEELIDLAGKAYSIKMKTGASA